MAYLYQCLQDLRMARGDMDLLPRKGPQMGVTELPAGASPQQLQQGDTTRPGAATPAAPGFPRPRVPQQA